MRNLFLFMLLCYCGAAHAQTTDTTFTGSGAIEKVTFSTNNIRDSLVYYNEKRWDRMVFVPKGNGSVGTWKIYSKMGFKIFEYSVANNQKNGTYCEFFRNGQLRRKEFYVENLRSGNSTSYYENGNVRIQSSYYQDKLDGTIRHYYSNGNLMWKGDYQKGHMTGERIYYDEKGELINGSFVIKNAKGNTEREGTCVNGRPEGELKIYTDEGNLSIASSFKNGLPHGLTLFYGTNQKLAFTQLYKNGRFKKETRLDTRKK